MTKLTEWLYGVTVILAVWYTLITNKIENEFTRQYMYLIFPAPLIFIILFGLYAATIVLYRVFTFNDCPQAAADLQKDIAMAKEDLKSKGYNF